LLSTQYLVYNFFFHFQGMETNNIMVNIETMEMQNMVINIDKIIIILVEETIIMRKGIIITNQTIIKEVNMIMIIKLKTSLK